VKAELNVIKL